jgi:anaerobic selenocysteine-containing dehydrogenase
LPQTAQVNSFVDVTNLIDRMNAGELDMLFIQGANPVFELPAASGFADAMARVPFVVSFSPFVDETAVQSDLILPDRTDLESWGYQIPSPGTDRPVVSSQQPVVSPLYDSRATADVLLALAARLGGEVAQALPWSDEIDFLQSAVSDLSGSSLSAFEAETPASFWALWRQSGGWWSEKEIPREPEVSSVVKSPLPVIEPKFEGDAQVYPLHLYPYPSIALSDGRGANLPWLQETPDPMTTATWGTWVELHPDTARSLGVGDNDIVRVSSPLGSLGPRSSSTGLRPDVVAIPVGQGHSD